MLLKNLIFRQGEKEISLFSADTKVVSLTGLGPVSEINYTNSATREGVFVNNIFYSQRTITMELVNFGMTYKSYTEYVYQHFLLGKIGTLVFESEDGFDRKIECYIKEIKPSNISENDTFSIQLFCTNPFFYSSEKTSFIASTVGSFSFEFENPEGSEFQFGVISSSLVSDVVNEGELATGCIFRIRAVGDCSNPKITSAATYEWLQVDINMAAGDELIVSTYTGEKGVTLVKDGVESNYINYLVYGSKFLQIDTGVNTFIYSAGSNSGNLEISCIFKEKYGGV